jgi:hypothetical protein
MKSILIGAAMFAVVASVYACSDHDDEHEHVVPTDEAGGHTSPYPSCNAITKACHAFDVGEGPIHDCHEVGHEATSDEPCAAVKTKCLALCVEEGGTDAGGEAAADAADHDGH